MNTPKLIIKGMIALSAIGMSLATAEAAVIHRYDFNGNANDGIGTLNGALSGAGSNEEAPSFTADIPAGANTDFAANSIEVGMTIGSGNVSFANFGGGTETEMFDGKVGSMAYWFKADALNNARELVSSVGGAGALRTLTQSDGDVRLGGAGLGNIDYTFTNPVTVDTWHHLVLAWSDVSGILTVALDGQIQTAPFTAGDLTDPARLILGNFAPNDSQTGTQFEGHIYDLQFYDTQLTQDEIAKGFNNPGLSAIIAPEPSSIALLGFGAVMLLKGRRRTLSVLDNA